MNSQAAKDYSTAELDASKQEVLEAKGTGLWTPLSLNWMHRSWKYWNQRHNWMHHSGKCWKQSWLDCGHPRFWTVCIKAGSIGIKGTTGCIKAGSVGSKGDRGHPCCWTGCIEVVSIGIKGTTGCIKAGSVGSKGDWTVDTLVAELDTSKRDVLD